MNENQETKKSDDAGIFPKIHAETVVIPIAICENSPLESVDDVTARRNLVREDLSPSQANPMQYKQWSHTPKDINTASAVQGTASPEFFSTHESKKKLISKKTCEDSKMNLEEEIQKQDAERILNEDHHKLKVELVQTQIQVKNLTEQNLQLRTELDIRTNELADLMLAFDEERTHNADLEEHVTLMEQQIKDPTKLQALRGQVLENMKMEMSQLRMHLQTREKRIMELEAIISKRESEQRIEGNCTFKQIHELCAEVQKYKLLLVATTRQTQELQNEFNRNQLVNKNAEEKRNFNNREITNELKQLQEENKRLEGIIKTNKLTIDNDRSENVMLEQKYNELKEKYEKAFNELNEVKEEIGQFGKLEKRSESAFSYSEQILQMKEQFNKKLQATNEELIKCKEETKRKDEQIAEYERKLQEDPLMDLVGEPNEEVLEEIKHILEVKENESLQGRVEELLAEAEEYKLVKAQHQQIEETLKESQKIIENLRVELELEKNSHSELEKVNEELKNYYERLNDSKIAIQTQLNNVNETLKIKQQEISILIQSRDAAENNEKAIREELEELSSLRQVFIKFINDIANALKFSFINLESPIILSMTNEEISKIKEFTKYIQDLKEIIEVEHSTNIKTIESLKELNKLHENVSSEKEELKVETSLLKEDIKEIEKFKNMLSEERMHNMKMLEDIEERHKIELEAANSSKEIIINQLQEKVKLSSQKVAKKKEKLAKQITCNEKLLKRQNELTIENQQLKDEIQGKVENTESLVVELTESKDIAKKVKDELANQNTIHKKMIEELTYEVKDKDESIKSLKNSLDKLKLECASSAKIEPSKTEYEAKLQQQLLQIHESNAKINDLEENINDYKLQVKNLLDEKNSLIAECKRLKGLCDTAKSDMKKMITTTKRMSNSRSDLNDSASSVKLSDSPHNRQVANTVLYCRIAYR